MARAHSFRSSANAAGSTIPLGPSMDHEPHTEEHPNRYGNPSPPPVAIQAHAARSTLITQVSRSLVLINALGTTGILIPKALNAARRRAAWIASIHAIPASISIMYGDFNFVVSLTYPTAAPISSASASLAMLTSLSTLP